MANPGEPKSGGEIHRLEEEASRFSLHAELLPADVFEGNEAQERSGDPVITDIASSGDYTIVVRKRGKGKQERMVLDTYDKAGKRHELKETPILDLSWAQLLPGFRKVDRRGGGYGGRNSRIGLALNTAHAPTNIISGQSATFKQRLRDDGAFQRGYRKIVDALFEGRSAESLDDPTKARDHMPASLWESILSDLESGKIREPFNEPVRVKVVQHPIVPLYVVRSGTETLVYKADTNEARDVANVPESWVLWRGADGAEVFRTMHRTTVLKPLNLSEQQLFSDKGGPLKNLDLDAYLEEEKGLLTLAKRDGSARLWSTDKARDFAIDPQDGQSLAFLNSETNTIDALDPKDLQAGQFGKVTQRKVEAVTGELREVAFDPNGNFILIHAWQDRESGGSGTLVVLERDTLEKVQEFMNVKGRMEVDPDGNIYYEDMEGRLRIVKTNFKNLPTGGTEAARTARREALTRVRSAIQDIKIEDLVAASAPAAAEAAVPERISRDALATEARNKLWELFGPRVAEASVEDIATMRQQLAALRAREGFVEFPEAFRPIEQAIDGRESEMRTAALEERLQVFEEKLAGAGAEVAIGLEREFTDLLAERQRVAIADADARSRVGATVIRLRKTLDEKMAVFQEELARNIGERIDRVVDLIGTMGSVEELQRLPQHPEFEELEHRILHLKDREAAKQARQRLGDAIQQQRQRIEELGQRERLAERERAAVVLDQTANLRDEIADLIRREVASVKDFDRWRGSQPLLTRHRATALALPEEVRQTEEVALDELLAQARRELEHREQLGVPASGKEVRFGEEAFPVYEATPVVWQPIVEPIAPGSEHGRLLFRDNLGRTCEPPVGSLACDLSDDATKLMIERFTPEAEKFFDGQKRQVPKFDRRWKLVEHTVDELEAVSRLLKKQREQRSGILILEGEAGTGKNVLIDMFAHFTNREVFTISCNALMEKEDLTTSFRYDPEKGTYHLPSELVRALQTPGAIIVFDEINTLPPGVTKMLNSLLDYRRTLNLTDEHKSITAHPETMFIGLENPQHYIGTKKLAQEVISRARVHRVGYPPATEGGRKRSDEVVMMSAHLPAFAELSDTEVAQLFDYVVNGDRASGGDAIATPQREDLITKMADVVHVANVVRKAYDDFHGGASPEIVEIVFSLRESMDIATELPRMSARAAIKEVLLPKIGDPEQRRRIEVLVDNA